MTVNALPETSKFTPEQRRSLGQVYAMILRWGHEDKSEGTQDACTVNPLDPSKQLRPASGNNISTTEAGKE